MRISITQTCASRQLGVESSRHVARSVGTWAVGRANGTWHRACLHDREEAPDRGLLHEVGRDRGGHDGARQQQEGSLDQHTPLLPHGQKGCEHHKSVDLRRGHEVARVGHRHAPRQVILAVEGAQLLAWVVAKVANDRHAWCPWRRGQRAPVGHQ